MRGSRWGTLGGGRGPGYHLAVMPFRKVALLVLTYLALDFANPMMPGAVQIVDGSLATVAGCPTRGAEVPAPVVAALPRDLSTIAPRREPARPAGRDVAVAPFGGLRFRLPSESRSTALPSSDD